MPKTVKENITQFIEAFGLPMGHACYILAMMEMAGGDPQTLTTNPDGSSNKEFSEKFLATMQRYVNELAPGGIVMLARRLNEPQNG